MSERTIAGVRLSVAALTDRGLARAANEDSFMDAGPAFVVADGMGGHERGDQASAAVVAAFADLLTGDRFGTFAEVRQALLDADDKVAAVAEGTTKGAGSTATGVVLVHHEGGPFWLVFNVGDSRVYRLVKGRLSQLTVDHSLGRELVDAGAMAAEDLPTFIDRNVITRAIGAMDSLADSWLLPVIAGERLLLCSDGLYGEVDDASIRAVLAVSDLPEAAAEALVHRALEHGGRDNVTVVIIDVLAVNESDDDGLEPIPELEPDDDEPAVQKPPVGKAARRSRP